MKMIKQRRGLSEGGGEQNAMGGRQDKEGREKGRRKHR